MANPYSTPQAALAEPGYDGATYEPSIFSMSGRLGRVRYFVYSGVLSLLMWVVVGALVGGAFLISGGTMSSLVKIAIALSYAVALFQGVVLGRRRLHDLDKSGWMLLLMLVPLVNLGFALWLMFARGTDGPNNHGLPPPPNSQALIIGFWVALALAVACGIAANIAMKGITEKMMAGQGMAVPGVQATPDGNAEQ